MTGGRTLDAERCETLLRQVRACRLCASQLSTEPRPILQLDPRARILVAGQAPGARAHASGVPFDDPSGDRLRGWMGVSRDVFYDPLRIAILPMGFCYPGRGRSGDLPPRPECAPVWRDRLLATLKDVRLTLVIGAYAQAFHLPEGSRRSVTESVRAWRDQWPAVLALPHPSPRNDLWLRRNPWFETDVLPVLRKRIAALGPGAASA
jgi:uracil-DNA glycosylase